MDYTPEAIARVCHEACRELQYVQRTATGSAAGDPGPWDELPGPDRDAAIAAVVAVTSGTTAAQLHDQWRRTKLDDGWTYGLQHDPVTKTHPDLVPYGRLAGNRKDRDILFVTVAAALSGAPAVPADTADAAQAGYEWITRNAPRLAAAGATAPYQFEQLCAQLGVFITEHPDADADAARDQARDMEDLMKVRLQTEPRADRTVPVEVTQSHVPHVGDQIRYGSQGFESPFPRVGDQVRYELPRRIPAVPAEVHRAVPRVGDHVHYVSYGTPGGEYASACRAAVVTASGTGIAVSLCVLNPTGIFLDRGIRHDPGTYSGGERTARPGDLLPAVTCADLQFPGGTWHWPS